MPAELQAMSRARSASGRRSEGMESKYQFGKPVPTFRNEDAKDVPSLDWTISKETLERIERIERCGRWWWQL